MNKFINTLSQIFESYIQEDYPSSFNMEEFKLLTSFRKRIAYCEKHLKRISSGSSRIVYQIDNEKVLKLAKNKKGLAQNEVEHTYSNDPYISDIFAEVLDADTDNFLWIEMELARKVTKPLFKSIVGIPFDEYTKVLQYYDSTANPQKYKHYSIPEPDNMEDHWEDEFFRGMFDYLGNFNVPVGDLMKLSSYGIVRNNEIVLIDYGFDDGVAKEFYS